MLSPDALPRTGRHADPRETHTVSHIDANAEPRANAIAVLLPCYNEEATIAGVVNGFRAALPSAEIYVYDNNSTDQTSEEAARAGAIVRREMHQGKGNVVRRMFADIDADIFVLADGDGTYEPAAAAQLINRMVQDNLDMVVGTRVGGGPEAYRRGHRFGNRMFNHIVGYLFGRNFSDILSGYRVFSRRFAKSFPAASNGFEIETELSVHAIDIKLATAEIPLPYGERPSHSPSKLRTYHDGMRILWTIMKMYRALRPFRFYGIGAIVLAMISVFLALPVFDTYLETGLVPRLPTAVLAASIMQLAFLSFMCGIIIESVSNTRRELKRMRYLDLPSLAASRRRSERAGVVEPLK
ncbi:MAG: glycosyl transferase [Hyphomicrobiales bacterium]|nr:MAG: glycosyl transferase [Hyphomicrobiales bacterium]